MRLDELRVGVYYPPDDPTKPPPPWNERPLKCLGCHAVVPPSGHSPMECFNVLHSRIAELEKRK